MPEYRLDPLTGQTVIVAVERAARPHQFDIEENGNASPRHTCPFCEGNESMTPGEIASFRPASTEPDTSGWSVRCVPNKFPAVAENVDSSDDFRSFQARYDTTPPIGGLFHPIDGTDFSPVPGFGHHEVIVDTPRHVLSVSDMSESEISDMFRMYRERLRTLRRENRWDFVQIFKNVGAAAGASIPHAHSQLVAMPFVPQPLCRVLRRAARYRTETEPFEPSRCFWCDMLRFETRNRSRIVEETDGFVVLCPFVSRFAAEVEIYPKVHQSSFEQIEDERIPEFARQVRQTILRLEKAVSWMKGPLAYNFVLHTEPFSCQGEENGSFHWNLSILPSLARAAGFEWGTGLHINPISPEYAAGQLRKSPDELGETVKK